MINLPLLAKVPFIMNVVMVVWVFVTIALILIILIQKGKGGGLSGAFGGLGAGGLLGTKTGDFLTWVTICFVVAFLGLAVLMVKYYKPIPPEDLMGPTTTTNLEGALPTGAGAGATGGEATETPTTTTGGEGTTAPGASTGETEGAGERPSGNEPTTPGGTAAESGGTTEE